MDYILFRGGAGRTQDKLDEDNPMMDEEQVSILLLFLGGGGEWQRQVLNHAPRDEL
jgi:hypothetical protein